MKFVFIRAVAEKALFCATRGEAREKGFDGEDHAVHEFEFFVLGDAGFFVSNPLLVVEAATISIKNVEIIDSHFFLLLYESQIVLNSEHLGNAFFSNCACVDRSFQANSRGCRLGSARRGEESVAFPGNLKLSRWYDRLLGSIENSI